MTNKKNNPLHRSFLKWAGGKKKVIPHIAAILPAKGKRRLVEPFVGGGSVFLNLEFDSYLLVDMNHDLIALFNIIKHQSEAFIAAAQVYFSGQYNEAEQYYALRAQFNASTDAFERAVLFVYLNRHGYNGLCRYNQKGGYNVPFGRYKHPYFPADEIRFFAQKAQRATFIQGDFAKAFEQLQSADVVYCDPPYSPINPTSNFTAYAGNAFTDEDQARIVACAQVAQEQGVATVISNHFVPFTKALYKDATKQSKFAVQRNISQKGKGRVKVQEVLALYK
jgi:DNA adenine methylase